MALNACCWCGRHNALPASLVSQRWKPRSAPPGCVRTALAQSGRPPGVACARDVWGRTDRACVPSRGPQAPRPATEGGRVVRGRPSRVDPARRAACDGGPDGTLPPPRGGAGSMPGGVIVMTPRTRQRPHCVARWDAQNPYGSGAAHRCVWGAAGVARGTREGGPDLCTLPPPTAPAVTTGDSDFGLQHPGQPASDLSHVELPVGLKHITRRRMRKQLRMS